MLDLLSCEPLQSPSEAQAAPTMREYQSEAVEAVLGCLETRGDRSTLMVMATGLGKTVTFGEVAKRYRDRGLRTLVIAHSVILVDQAYEALRRMGLSVGVEQAERRCLYGRPPDVVVATVQSLTGRRLRGYPSDHFGLVVADESHRALAKQHRNIFNYFSSAKILGVTATPDRGDGKSLGNVFQSVAFERDMLWGIKNGWLSQLEFRTCVTRWDPKQLKVIAGDVDAGSVERELLRSNVLTEAAATLAELGAGRRVVAFLPTVASAKAFSVELEARGIASGSVDGETPPIQRQNMFRDLREGRISVLCNCAVLIEGFDVPSVDTIALLSPTKSRSRLAQCIGRGTRIADGKEFCLVLDFCPGRLKSGRLASPADALAGTMLDDDVIEHVRDGNLVEAVERAEKTKLELEDLKRQEEERAKWKAEKLAKMRNEVGIREVDYSIIQHEAQALLDRLRSHPENDGKRVERTARPQLTNEQRIRAGLATEKQAMILAKKGLNPYMKRKLANEAMELMKANGWKPTEEMKKDKRFYAGTKERADAEAEAHDKLRRLGLAI